MSFLFNFLVVDVISLLFVVIAYVVVGVERVLFFFVPILLVYFVGIDFVVAVGNVGEFF